MAERDGAWFARWGCAVYSVASVVLLVVGVLATGVGALVIGFGIPINGLPVGQTMIIAGTMAIVGGPILIGLAVAVSRLAQIVEALKGRPPNRAVRPASAFRAEEAIPDPRQVDVRPSILRSMEPRQPEPRQPEPRRPEPRRPEFRPAEPRPVEPAAVGDRAAEADASVAVSAAAIERLRSTMVHPVEGVPLSPTGAQQAAEGVPDVKAVEVATEARISEPAAQSAEVDTAKEARLEFLFRQRPARRAPQESFDVMWPKRSAQGGGDQPKVVAAIRPSVVDAPPPAAAPAAAETPVEEKRAEQQSAGTPAATDPQRGVAVLKSGVVDGMAYTLYADGSIEAELPQGTVRFGSIAELRSHVENNS